MEKEQEKIIIPEIITVGEFAKKLDLPVSSVMSELIKNGVMATINDNIDFETAEIISEYLGISIAKETEETLKPKETKKGLQNLEERPPVVAVMGHVDHGKTSLLDAIKETNVVAKEKGGITQHIGAYQIERKGKKITFLDTPGHEAFAKMREHGAKVTDLAIIVVAADDGVKPQTREAVDHAKRANTPMIVAINKIDKPGADIDRVKSEIAELGLVPEDWGGNTVTVEVSAKEKKGLDNLLDMVLLSSDVLELKADYDAQGQGVVIESHLDPGKGAVATVLVKNGHIRLGDSLQVGDTYGKIKSMDDFRGKKIEEAGPSVPVKISGLKSVPQVSELAQVFDDEKDAKKECEMEKKLKTVKSLTKVKKIGVEEITKAVEAAGTKELQIVLKADVQGSLDAIKEALQKFNTKEVAVNVIHDGVGNVTDKDVTMALSSTTRIVFGFNVGISASVLKLAEREGVRFSKYGVIYELLDDVRSALEGLLPPEIVEIETGALEVLKVFKIDKKETVAGGKVISGKIEKGLKSKIFRGKEEIKEADLTTLKREKDEVSEVLEGTECGLGFSEKIEIEEKDVIKQIRIEERKRTL